MKVLSKLIIILFIIIFPLVSYLYLRSGYYIRKDALDHLSTEIPFNQAQLNTLKSIDTMAFEEWTNEGLIIHRVSDDGSLADMYKFAEYLKGRTDFNILALFPNKDIQSYNDTLYSKTITRHSMLNSEIDHLMDENVDNWLCYKLQKRASYQNTRDQLGLLYKHTVILLPTKKKEKLSLKRNNEF